MWNSLAIRNMSIIIAEAEKSRKLGKSMITLTSGNIEPPLPFNAEQITADLSECDCNGSVGCVGKIVESVERFWDSAKEMEWLQFSYTSSLVRKLCAIVGVLSNRDLDKTTL